MHRYKIYFGKNIHCGVRTARFYEKEQVSKKSLDTLYLSKAQDISVTKPYCWSLSVNLSVFFTAGGNSRIFQEISDDILTYVDAIVTNVLLPNPQISE